MSFLFCIVFGFCLISFSFVRTPNTHTELRLGIFLVIALLPSPESCVNGGSISTWSTSFVCVRLQHLDIWDIKRDPSVGELDHSRE